MNDLEERFSSALHSTSRAWLQPVDRRLKHLGVIQASWMTIAIAAKARSPLSQSELADKLGVEGATMVAMIDRLVNAGLVLRQASTPERRVTRVLITRAGAKIYERVKAEAAALRKELLTDTDPKKLLIATELLESLQGIIETKP